MSSALVDRASGQSGARLQYSAYKASETPWLKQLPVHWELARLKYVATVSQDRRNEKPADLPYLGLENVESGTGRLLLQNPVDEVSSVVGLFDRGDVLFGKLRPYLAKVVHAHFRGVCTTELLIYRPNQNCDGKYLHYQMLSDWFIEVVSAMTYGAKMPRANAEQIGNLIVSVPPLSEQRVIAAYLDRETARIDALVAKKERLIAVLEEKRAAMISQAVTRGLDPAVALKDSDVSWLGQVPDHWQVRRLKSIAQVHSGIAKGRKTTAPETIDVPYLRVANVQDGYLDLAEITTIPVTLEELRTYSLKSGDVLMNEGGDFDKLGRGCVWYGEIEPCLHQNHVFAVRPTPQVESNWLAVSTLTHYAKHFFILNSKQSTNLASISSTNLKELPIVLPPPAERAAILAHVAAQTARIDSLIAKVRIHIERLREHRTALISAAVTGQIDVREASG